MKKEYIFALILAILCFLGGYYYGTYHRKEQTLLVNKGIEKESILVGNDYSTYNRNKRTLFVNKGVLIKKETPDPYEGINYAPSADPRKVENTFKKGIIPDAETACKVAIPIIKAVYGEQQLISELPLQITLFNDKIWVIEGTLDAGKGGVVLLRINKGNGCVLSLTHGK